MDHDIAVPETWQAEWLDRTYTPLRDYILLSSYALSLSIIGLSIANFLTVRRHSAALLTDPSSRAQTFKTMNASSARIHKGHFSIALLYLLNVIAFTAVDAIICIFLLKDDIASNPSLWDTRMILEVTIYCLYLFTIFIAAFTLFPLLQMLLATQLLARSSRHANHPTDLDFFIPQARFFSTHMAQIWCMLAFFVVSWWVPNDDSHPTLRHLVVQACFGSALAWLEASFAFNFHAEVWVREDLERACGQTGETIAVLKRKFFAVCGKESGEGVLPVYEASGEALLSKSKSENEKVEYQDETH